MNAPAKDISSKAFAALRPAMAAAAQKIYDAWDQSGEDGDPDLGFGGICQDIAAEIAGVLTEAGFDATTLEATVGEQHVFAVAKASDGVFEVDIPHSLYETGGGYVWQKLPEVRFTPSDISIERLSSKPEDYRQYSGEDPDHELYMKGGCHILATALHREHGFDYLLLVNKTDIYPSGAPAVIHVFAVDSEDNAYDYMGRHSADNIRRQWTFADGSATAMQECVSLSDEKDLQSHGYVGPSAEQPLATYTDDEVRDALLAAQRQLGSALPRAAAQLNI